MYAAWQQREKKHGSLPSDLCEPTDGTAVQLHTSLFLPRVLGAAGENELPKRI